MYVCVCVSERERERDGKNFDKIDFCEERKRVDDFRFFFEKLKKNKKRYLKEQKLNVPTTLRSA